MNRPWRECISGALDLANAPDAETFELDCASCHQGAHEAQRNLYMGAGGHGADDAPSSMFRARVSCGSCHGLPREIQETADQTIRIDMAPVADSLNVSVAAGILLHYVCRLA